MKQNIDFRLFPDILFNGNVYSNYDEHGHRMVANSNIPLLRVYNDAGENSKLFLVGEGSLGKSTSLKILEADLLCRYGRDHKSNPLCWFYECKHLDDKDKIVKIEAIAKEFKKGVLIFDAFDELPETSINAFVSTIAKINDSNISVIISSRFAPHEMSDVAFDIQVFKDYEILKLCCFSDKQLDSIVSKSIDRTSGYYSLLKSTMFLSMHLEMEQQISYQALDFTIKTEAEFIEQYFSILHLQKNNEALVLKDVIHIGQYEHRQRLGRSNRNAERIPSDLQHIFFYRNDLQIDAIQIKYLNYVHATYLEETLLQLWDDSALFDDCTEEIIKLFDVETSNTFSEPFYYLGQLLCRKHDENSGLIRLLNDNFPKTSRNYCNLLSLMCGYDNDTLRDSHLFHIVDAQDVLAFNTSLRKVRGLKHFVVPEGVSTIGNGVFFYCRDLEDITIGSNVTEIGKVAFYRCNSLERVIFSSTVKTIYDSAFWECTNLKQVVFPKNLERIEDSAFYGCSGLISIEIPKLIKKIGNWAFSCCCSLRSITVEPENIYFCSRDNCLIDSNGILIVGCQSSIIPCDGSIKEISKGAFWGQSELKCIVIPKSVEKIGAFAFVGCFGLEKISVEPENPIYHSFQNCLIETASKTVISCCKTSILPQDDSVQIIGPSAYQGCVGLSSVFIPANIVKIEEDAFRDCSSIESIEVDSQNQQFYSIQNCLIERNNKRLILGCKNSVMSNDRDIEVIGRGSFRGCRDLTAVCIPNSVKIIEDFAFSSCPNIDHFQIEVDHPKFEVVSNCLINRDNHVLVCGCKNSIIPCNGEVTAIGKAAFDGCVELPSVAIPLCVTEILDFAFRNCVNLFEVNINGCVHTIGNSAFRGCTGLKKVVVGRNVKKICNAAFMDCNNLTQIVYEGSQTEWEHIEMEDDAVPYTIRLIFLG